MELTQATMIELIIYGLVGFVGALTTMALMPKPDKHPWCWIRKLWLGAVAGALYHVIAVNYLLPNGVASFLMGATAQVWLESLIMRHKKTLIVEAQEDQDGREEG